MNISGMDIYIYICMYKFSLRSGGMSVACKKTLVLPKYVFGGLVWTIPPIAVVCAAVGAIAQMYL